MKKILALLPSRGLEQVIATIILFAGSATLAWTVNSHYPVTDWLFPRFAVYFALAGFHLAACLSFGLAIQKILLGTRIPLLERLVIASSLGLVGFTLGWAVLGFMRQFHAVSFVLWPTFCLMVGSVSHIRSAKRHLRYLSCLNRLRTRHSLLSMAVLAFGAIGLLLVYAPIMTPQNVSFDARWYHLPLAERYALEQGIVRFPEGWMLAGYPPLPSLFYSWAFCLPGATTFDRVELCAHLEFVWFAMTLVGIPVLTRRLLPTPIRQRTVSTGLAWVTVFLFPGIFVYDSALSAGADHIAAIWAIPLYLLVMRTQRELPVGGMIALGLCVIGVLLTKYTAYGLLVFPALWMTVRVITRLFRREDVWMVLKGSLVLLALVCVGTSPYWLRNLIWYGNPVFPLLADVFPTRPWTSESTARMATLVQGNWKPSRNVDGLIETLRQLYTFSFVPHNWPTFHGKWPVFGSLFTLTAPLALVFRNRRLLALYLAAHLAVLFWFWTFHQDRYLQAFLPWMAAATATTLIQAWHVGPWTRWAAAALVGLQAVWGGDTPFFGTHALSKQPLQHTVELLRGGFAGKGDARFVAYPDWDKLSELLPPGSRVLRHENQVHLGLRVPSITDWFQTGISYGARPEAHELFDLYTSMDATHALWQTQSSRGYDSLAADIAFFYYVVRFAESPQTVGGYSLARLPTQRPEPEALHAMYVGCDGTYEKGLYNVRALNIMPHPGLRRTPADYPAPFEPIDSAKDVATLLPRAQVLVYDTKCMKIQARLLRDFTSAARRGSMNIYVRKR